MQKQKIYLAKYKPCNMHVGQVTRYIFSSIFTFLSQNKKDNKKRKRTAFVVLLKYYAGVP